MNQMKKKLHSNSGASMILALALMLICVMVSSVIIVAAASGIDRNKEKLKQQQEYLAVTSAAKYIAENMNPEGNDRFTGVLLKNEKPCFKYKNYRMESNIRVNGTDVDAYAIPSQHVVVEANEPDLVSVEQIYMYVKDTNPSAPDVDIFCPNQSEKQVVESTTELSGTFSELMKSAAEEVFVHGLSYTNEFTIKVGDDRIPDVKCRFTMDTDYNVSIVIRSITVVEEIVEESEYYMIIHMYANSPAVNAAGYKTTETCTHNCFYEYCDVVGNIQTSNIRPYTLTHEVDNPTTTITWDKPVIIKGGAI